MENVVAQRLIKVYKCSDVEIGEDSQSTECFSRVTIFFFISAPDGLNIFKKALEQVKYSSEHIQSIVCTCKILFCMLAVKFVGQYSG